MSTKIGSTGVTYNDATVQISGAFVNATNLGTGNGQLFTSKTGSNIQFKSIAGTGNAAISSSSATLTITWTGGACACDCVCVCDCDCACATSCFLADSPVLMEDGTYKSIQDVVPGDRVVGAFGEVNQVLALDQVILGHRYMYKINGEHDTADDHPHISVDKKIYSCDVDAIYREWGNYYECKVRDGTTVLYNSGLKLGRVTQLKIGHVLKTTTGGKEVASIEKYTIDPKTPLYNLVVDGSHTYFVNGYAVTGWPREDDFDYNTWTQKEFRATIEDYRIPPKS